MSPFQSLVEAVRAIQFTTPLPEQLIEIEQTLAAPCVENLPATVAAEVGQLLSTRRVAPGASVGIGVGSRGIARLPEIVRATVDAVRAAGAEPFVFPAMGSHGGATVEGQIEVIQTRGVTEASVGAPFRATMDVDEIGAIEGGPRLYQGRDSAAADHVLLISRVKPHTDFRGPLESGPAKMAVIGLGKQTGAEAMHECGGEYFVRFLGQAARIYAERTNLLGALCVVENGQHDIARAQALPAHDFGGPAEVDLLRLAGDLLPRLPLDQVDVLVVRELGKDISGAGMDPNVVGRLRVPTQPENFGNLQAAILAVLDLSAGTHGHSTGMGLADITTVRLLEKIDWATSYTNGLTAAQSSIQRHLLPMVMADDRRALQAAVHCCGRPARQASLCLIQNTSSLERFWVTPDLAAALDRSPNVRVLSPTPLAFAADGALVSPWQMD